MPLGELILERDSATAGAAHRAVTGDRHTAEPSALLTTRLSDRGRMAGDGGGRGGGYPGENTTAVPLANL